MLAPWMIYHLAQGIRAAIPKLLAIKWLAVRIGDTNHESRDDRMLTKHVRVIRFIGE